MTETFKELITFLKNPILEEDINLDASYRFKKFLHLLVICLVTGLAISPIFGLIEHLELIDMENHAMEEMLDNLPKAIVFIAAVIFAPLIEETLFRAPLVLFKGKNIFKYMFYFFAILFGFIHITNFEMTTNVLLLSPILVLPQILLGGYLGFIRVRFGLIWSIALHAAYNGILMLITFSADIF